MKQQIQASLLPLDHPNQVKDSFKCAAVLMPIVKNADKKRWEVIFTRRADHLKHHPGQVSFPGGGFEQQDSSLADTAIRETFEEIGIAPYHINLLGSLPQLETVSQYNVMPFVGIVNSSYQLKIDANEVAEVFKVPFDYLTAPQNQKRVKQTIDGTEYSFYVIDYQQYNIWGATSKIIVNFTRRFHANAN